MDATRLANLKTEINALATFLSAYDTSVTNYLNTTTTTCVHFLDVVPGLSNDNTFSLAYNGSYDGQGSSFGALGDFVYEVSAIQRNTTILQFNKLSYYLADDVFVSSEADFNKGEAAKTISYITGTSPDQGITI